MPQTNSEFLEGMVRDYRLIGHRLTSKACCDLLELNDSFEVPSPKSFYRYGDKRHVLRAKVFKPVGHLPLVRRLQSKNVVEGATVDELLFEG